MPGPLGTAAQGGLAFQPHQRDPQPPGRKHMGLRCSMSPFMCHLTVLGDKSRLRRGETGGPARPHRGVSVLMESRPRTPFPTARRVHLASDSVSWHPSGPGRAHARQPCHRDTEQRLGTWLLWAEPAPARTKPASWHGREGVQACAHPPGSCAAWVYPRTGRALGPRLPERGPESMPPAAATRGPRLPCLTPAAPFLGGWELARGHTVQ